MAKKQIAVATLAEKVGGEVIGDGAELIEDLDGIETAKEGYITFLVKASQAGHIAKTQASAVIVPKDVGEESAYGKTLIKVANPYLASAVIHNFLLEEPFKAKGVHSSAHIGNNNKLGEAITVEPFAVLGDNVTVGERVYIGAGTVIGDNVTIGDDTVLRPNVTIENGTTIGDRVIIHAGTVIGSDGYGYAADEQGRHIKRPQVGIVRIDDDVEIGSNCCVDRASYGLTWIKSGTKIDNQVQIAHNVVIGENCLLVSHSACSGSTTLGRNVILGGKASTKGHVKLGDGAMVAGKGGVTRNIEAGAVVGGFPAIPIQKWTKAATAYSKIPDLRVEVRKLRKELDELKKTMVSGKRD